jgi:hypothetical protein
MGRYLWLIMTDFDVVIEENFLTNEESDYCINYHKKNFNVNDKNLCFLHRQTEVLSCIGLLNNGIIKNIYFKLNKFIKKIHNKCSINYFQIVKWPEKECQEQHLDFDHHPFTSILYLNDNFEGGQTIVGNTVFPPVKNRIICFRGNKILHKVNLITNGTRYTLPSWYKYD